MNQNLIVLPAKNSSEAAKAFQSAKTDSPPTSYIVADNTEGTTNKRLVGCYVEDRNQPIGLVVVAPQLNIGQIETLDISGRGWYVTLFQFHWESWVNGKWEPRAGKTFVAGQGQYWEFCPIKWVPASPLLNSSEDVELSGERKLPSAQK